MNKLSSSLVRCVFDAWLDNFAQASHDSLATLDERGLCDIGLTHSEIASVRAEYLGHRPATRHGVFEAFDRRAHLA
jgi:hypothetical protein